MLFPVKAKTELEDLKAAVCCNCVSVSLFIEIILIVSFFRFETSSEKAELFSEKKSFDVVIN